MTLRLTSSKTFRWSEARERFAAMIPQIRRTARTAFAGAAPKRQDELVMRTIGHAQKVYLELALRGFSELAYPQPLAAVALAQVRSELLRSASHRMRC
jgi:hypothetical protein